jgi:endonuclease YncB( thermonuclease family)
MLRAAILAVLLCVTSARAETLEGPYAAEVLRVLDGDSFEARVRIWLDQDVTVIVRLRGIDAAELDAPCASARLQAVLAKLVLNAGIGGGTVTLSGISRDKYGGRVVAAATDAKGRDVSAVLSHAGLVRPYEGRRPDWCAGS